MAQTMLSPCIRFSLPRTLHLYIAFIPGSVGRFRPLGDLWSNCWNGIDALPACRSTGSTCRVGSVVLTFDLAAPAPATSDARSHLCHWLLFLELIVHICIRPLIPRSSVLQSVTRVGFVAQAPSSGRRWAKVELRISFREGFGVRSFRRRCFWRRHY